MDISIYMETQGELMLTLMQHNILALNDNYVFFLVNNHCSNSEWANADQ